MMVNIIGRVKICQVQFPGRAFNELGVIAQVEIPTTTFLWELNGVLSLDTYDKDAVSLIHAHPSQGLKGGPRFLAGSARFCNHSCRPNSIVCYHYFVHDFACWLTLKLYAVTAKPLFIVQAIRDIKPGEEITVSYGVEYWKDKQCLCEHCVASSTMSVWTIPTLWAS